jgi:D-glycero-D-manno-heptose 1,7-bisphosphate phosphatase
MVGQTQMKANKLRAVFLDRDGVLNHVSLRDGLPVGPLSIDDFRLIDGVGEAVARLKAAGFAVIVVTNQPELARGRLSPELLDQMHARLRLRVPVDAIYVCPHVDDDKCNCRKPNPGMLISAADEHGIELSRSYMVGDRWRDVEAGKAAGCRTVLVDCGYPEQQKSPPDYVVNSLGEAVTTILTGGTKRSPIGIVVSARGSDNTIHGPTEKPKGGASSE